MLNMTDIAERRWVPDTLIRFGIRRLCEQRLRDEKKTLKQSENSLEKRIQLLRSSPIAVETDAANEQHYEVPTEFFRYVMGDHMKYSSCWWDESAKSLTDAEDAMLSLYEERAELEDGQHILELGCGWGSLTLWMAERYPNSQITAVSNSESQRVYIENCAGKRRLNNINVITCDVNELQLKGDYDRIVSIEMFKHLRNYGQIFERLHNWLTPEGKVFIHIFCHRDLLYPFESEGAGNWMGRYFFTGGLMPAADTFSHFQTHLQIEKQWDVSGHHYQRTAEAWLENLDKNESAVRDVFSRCYGSESAEIWIQRWRIFFMSCAELFGYRNGEEWLVCHYRFSRK